MKSGDPMEVNHRAHDWPNIAEQMDETSVRKKLPQPPNVKRILRRSINPAFLRPIGSAAAFEPTPIKVSFNTRRFALFFQMVTVVENQVANGPAERGKQFISANIHCAQNRIITAGRTHLIGNADIDREVPHPV